MSEDSAQNENDAAEDAPPVGQQHVLLAQAQLPVPSIAVTPPQGLTDKGNLPEQWKLFKSLYKSYAVLAQLNKQSKEYKSATFLYTIASIGSVGVQLVNSLQFEPGEDEEDVDLIIKKLDAVIIGKTNVIYERYLFNNRVQQDDESIDRYVSDLIKMAKSCDFCECLHNQLIRDRLVVGIKDSATRKTLLGKSDLTLENAVDIC